MPFYMLFILLPNPLSTISIFEHIKNLKTMIEPIEELLQKKKPKEAELYLLMTASMLIH